MMISTPNISIIIPLFNKQDSILTSLSSVLSQECSVLFEIIVIDDGSTDKSAKIVLKLASKHSNIRYIKQDNAGPSAARNRGIELANGNWIMFLDADDILLPNALQTLYNTAKQHPDISLACGNFYSQTPDGKLRIPFPRIKSCITRHPLRMFLSMKLFPCQGTYIYSPQKIPHFHFDTNYNRFEDMKNLLDVFRNDVVVAISSSFVMIYRTSYSSASRKYDFDKDFSTHLSFKDKCISEKIILGGLLRNAVKVYPELRKQYRAEFLWCFLSILLVYYNGFLNRIARIF